MTNKERKVLELALDWIEKQPEETPHSKYDLDTRYVVLKELEAALAQQRTWVGLTDEDISEIVRGTHNTGSFVRAIEAKLKEKNNGIKE